MEEARRKEIIDAFTILSKVRLEEWVVLMKEPGNLHLDVEMLSNRLNVAIRSFNLLDMK